MTVKRVLSLIIVLAVILICSGSAFAMDRDSFGGWMQSALTAANITIQSTLPVVAPIADMLVDPFDIVEGVMAPIEYAVPWVNYETPSETLDNYLKRSHITIRGDLVTIDGIDYRDIWVDNTFAQACRTNVLDLQTAWEIGSNDSGNIASGVGTVDGIPVFDVSELSGLTVVNSTQFFQIPRVDGTYALGDTTVLRVSHPTPTTLFVEFVRTDNGSTFYTIGAGNADTFIEYFSLCYGGRQIYFPSPLLSNITYFRSFYVANPFSYTWVSRSIYPSLLDEDDGLHLLVPSDPSQFEDETVQDVITNINLNLVNNFTYNTDIDLSETTNYTNFDLLFQDVNQVINITKPSYGPYTSYDPTPTPTPTPDPTPEPTAEPTPVPGPSPTPGPWPSPVPSDPISDVPYTFLDDGLEKLWDTLQQGFHNVIDSVEVGEANYFGSIVDSLEDAFASLMERLASITGIWRYVVGWIGNISAPFSWALSALGSAGSYMLSPFYAIAAAAVIFAIYKRFGR